MDPANYRECLREAALDEAEGADIMMVKPAGAYLDIIRALKDSTTLPISAYQAGACIRSSSRLALLRFALLCSTEGVTEVHTRGYHDGSGRDTIT